MEEVKYRFTATGRNSSKEVFPQNGNTLLVSWEKEEENAYFRKSLKGKMLFIGDDFHWLYVYESSQYRCDPIQLVVEKRCEQGFSTFFVARLILNNAEFDLDQCTVSIQAEVEDKYTCYNDNKGKEFNLLAITYNKQTVSLIKGQLEYKTCSGGQDDDRWCGTGSQSDGWVILRYYSASSNPDLPDDPRAENFNITYVREVITSAEPLGSPWIDIGDGKYARQPALYGYRSYGGQFDFGYEYQVNGMIDNGMRLQDAMQSLLDQVCFPMKIKSNFFKWNESLRENENLLNPVKSTANAKLNDEGFTIYDADPYRKVTDFIRVIPGGQLWFQANGTYGSFGGNDKNGFYDINKNFISLAPPVPGSSFAIKIADLPNNVHYVRYQYYDEFVPGQNLMLYIGTEELPFKPYDDNNYVTGLPSKVSNLILFQKSDVKRPTGSNNATISNITLEKLVKDLCNMFNLKWDIDDDGDFVLEHVSFFQKGVGLNLVGRRDSRLRAGMRKYSYDIDNMPKREVFQMIDDKYTYGDFKGLPIIYSNSCVGQGEKENKDWIVENIMTDVSLALNNPNSDSQIVSDDGFILMACDDTNHILSEASILGGNTLNNTLSWARLHTDYWRHERVFSSFNMNNQQTKALSVVPTKKQVPLNVSLCCGDNFDVEELVATELGEGSVSRAEFNLYQEMLSLTLSYIADEDLFENSPPVAADDTVSTFVDISIEIDVLANDSDPDGTINPGTLTIQYGGLNGVSEVVNGKIRYTPNPGFSGDDIITYNVKDNWSEVSNTASVAIKVKTGSPLAIAGDDSFRIGQDVTLTVGTILSNDVGDGQLYVLNETKETEMGGTVEIYANGSFVYTPPFNYIGDDGFDYTLKDEANNTDIGHVVITVFEKLPVYVKYAEGPRRRFEVQGMCMVGTGSNTQTIADRFLITQIFTYYSDLAGTVPLDVTGYGLSVNMRRSVTGTGVVPGNYDYTVQADSTRNDFTDVIVQEDYYGCPDDGNTYSYNQSFTLLTSSAYGIVGQSTPQPSEPATLSEAGFMLGTAVQENFLNRPNEMSKVLLESREIVSENECKTSRVFPSMGVTDFVIPDQLVDWAEANSKDFHYHTSWWVGKEPEDTKAFVSNPSTTVQQAKDHLKYMIQTPILRYKGRMKSCDVINEPVKPGSLAWNQSVFIDKIGPEALKLAFVYAHEADPDLILLVNEFDWEYGGNKMNFLHTFIDECKAEGIPLHGVGLQFHRNVENVNESGIRTQLTRFVNKSMKIRISEVGLKLRYSPYITNNDDATFILTDAMQEAQGKKMVILMNAFETIVPLALKLCFVMWGVFDFNYKNNKGEKEYAMLFDGQGNRKKAYTMALAEKIRLNNL